MKKKAMISTALVTGIIAAGGVPNAVGRGWFSLIDGCPVYLFLRDDVLRID